MRFEEMQTLLVCLLIDAFIAFVPGRVAQMFCRPGLAVYLLRISYNPFLEACGAASDSFYFKDFQFSSEFALPCG